MRQEKTLTRWIVSLPDRIGRPPTRTSYIPQIDGLRCLAILIVVLWHISLRAARSVDALNANGWNVRSLYFWFPHGEIGVALFFMISGYVIAQPFMESRDAKANIGRFYFRRLRRIYPPYLIVITICLVLVLVTHFRVSALGPSPTESWFASAAYLHGILFDTASKLDPPIWSIEVEMQFYLLAPFLVIAYVRLHDPAIRRAVGCFCIAVLIVMASVVDIEHPFDPRFRFGLLAHAYLFVTGVVLADNARTRPASSERVAFDGVFLFGLALLGLVGLYLTHVDARPGGGWPDIAVDTAVVTAVVAIYFGAMSGRFSRMFLSSPWITLIGTMCYSIYLVHVVVIEAVVRVLRVIPLHDRFLIWPAYILVLGPVCLVVSVVFYVVVERPFMTSRPASPGSVGGLAVVSRLASVRRRG